MERLDVQQEGAAPATSGPAVESETSAGGALEGLVARIGRAGVQRALQRRLQRRASDASPTVAEAGGGRSEQPDAILKTAEAGTQGHGGQLPHLDAIQQSFGRHDVSSIVAHTDDQAARAATAIGAEAYATGDHVAFAGAPSLHTAAHEAAHVVQQRAGVHLKGGVGEEGDAYEGHADAVADAVVQGRSAEALLDSQVGPGDGGGAARAGAQRKALQRKDVATHYGTFKSTRFTPVPRGVDIVLEFHPDADKIDAKKIGLSQSVKITYTDGTHTGIDPAKEGRRVQSGGGADYVLDRISTRNNPIYGADSLGANEGLDKTAQDNNRTTDSTAVGTNATYQLGYSFDDGSGKKTKEAALSDRPTAGAGNVFETVALGLEGTDQSKYFGSVKWGYKLNAGTVEPQDIELASMGVPTQAFLAAADLWNKTRTRGTIEVTGDPAKGKDATSLAEVDVPKGTKGTQVGEAVRIADRLMVKVQTLDGSKQYYLGVTDLRDTQDGGKTVTLPVPQVMRNKSVTGWFSDAKMSKKVKDLAAGTRMENLRCMVDGSYEMRIVDGPDLGQTGYVDPKDIDQER